MSFPKNETQQEVIVAWRTYLDSLEKSMKKLDEDITEASEMAGICTDEWCEATEHVIDELSGSLFAISEPRFSDPEDSKRLKDLRRRVYDLYANYREVYRKV